MTTLGITWHKYFRTMITKTGIRLIQHMLTDLKSVQICLCIYRYINIFVLSQMLLFPKSFWAQINKYMGFFLWHHQTLRVQRFDLYKSIIDGGTNLKNLKIQSKALITHRLIQIICDHYNNIAYDAIMLVLHPTEAIAPVDLDSFNGSIAKLADIALEIMYMIIAKISMEVYCVKDLYKYYMTAEWQISSRMETKLGNKWKNVCKNIALLGDNSLIHYQMFLT